ncbi:hypothetical protein [Pyruvatibacter sp.]|uniref:hypothetical protein n=1 Tax=Pyruvatibacter sp. TaxID=1981328 RepID=UPI0032650974
MMYAKIGAVSYALWSVLHVVLGVSRLMERADSNLLAEATGRLAQGHWTLIYIGVFGLILSYFNWKNSTTAYWVAAFIISAEDIGFILFPVLYGGTPFPASVVGPGLWLIGLLFTTLAYVQAKKTDAPA